MRRGWSVAAATVLAVAGFVVEFDVSSHVALATGPVTTGRIAAGDKHTCVIRDDAQVWCWGDDSFGQLGSSSFGGSYSETPIHTSGFGGRTPVQVAAGANHTCALMSDGTVWCWGSGGYIQLGDPSGTTSLDPVQVSLGTTVSSIAVGGNTSCAVTTAGNVLCWGRNNKGQIGNGTTQLSGGVTPVQLSAIPTSFTLRHLELGGQHSCATSTAGAVWCWGYANKLQLGNTANSTTDQSTPVQTDSLGSTAASVSAGTDYSCALTTGGTVMCWGNNANGQLGRGSATPATSAAPTAVSVGSNVAVVSAGNSHACVVTTAGAALCWGLGSSGQVGSNSFTGTQATPTAVTGLSSGVVDIASGGSHTCALLDTGNVTCWGLDDAGQTGQADLTNRATPTVVAGLPATTTTTSTTTTLAPATTLPATTVPGTTPVTSPVATLATSSTSTTTTLLTSTTTSATAAATTSKSSVLTVRRGRSLTAARLAAAVGVAIPRGSRGKLRLSIVSGARACGFVGSSVRGLRLGTCRVAVTLIPKKGRTTTRHVTVRVSR